LHYGKEVPKPSFGFVARCQAYEMNGREGPEDRLSRKCEAHHRQCGPTTLSTFFSSLNTRFPERGLKIENLTQAKKMLVIAGLISSLE